MREIIAILITTALVVAACQRGGADSLEASARPTPKKIRMDGLPSGVVQSKSPGIGIAAGSNNIEIRRFKDSKIVSVSVGSYDFDYISLGDTIYSGVGSVK